MLKMKSISVCSGLLFQRPELMGLLGRELQYWGCGLEGDTGTPVCSSFFCFLVSPGAQTPSATCFHHKALTHHWPKKEGQATRDWNLWNLGQNDLFLFVNSWSHMFCHSSRKLINMLTKHSIQPLGCINDEAVLRACLPLKTPHCHCTRAWCARETLEPRRYTRLTVPPVPVMAWLSHLWKLRKSKISRILNF